MTKILGRAVERNPHPFMGGSMSHVGYFEDAIFTLSNLIASETHAIQSFKMNEDNEDANLWVEILIHLRDLRTKWMKTIVKESNSTSWCLTKHLLASSEGLIELGNRLTKMDRLEEAKEAYSDAGNLIAIIKMINGFSKTKKGGEEK